MRNLCSIRKYYCIVLHCIFYLNPKAVQSTQKRTIKNRQISDDPACALNSRRHGIRNFRIRVLLYGISVPIGYEFSAKHFQIFFFGAQLVFSFSIDVIFRRCYNLVIKREKRAASWWLFWILLFCLVFFDNEAF